MTLEDRLREMLQEADQAIPDRRVHLGATIARARAHLVFETLAIAITVLVIGAVIVLGATNARAFLQAEPPEITITSGPASATTETTATFQFSAAGQAAGFQCSRDGGSDEPCVSGVTYADLAVGPHRFDVRAITSSGLKGNAATWSWTVEAPKPDFQLRVLSAEQTISRGLTARYHLLIDARDGFRGPVTLGVHGLPGGAKGQFEPNPAAVSSELLVTTTAKTILGRNALTITGSSADLKHEVPVTLVINEAGPDFALTLSPSSHSVSPGGIVEYAITITPSPGFEDRVSLTVSGLPAGAVAALPEQATKSSTLVVTTTTRTLIGRYTLTVTGTSGARSHAAAAELIVMQPKPDFSLTVQPATRTGSPSGTVAYEVSIVRVNGFGGQVTMKLSGLPPGAQSMFRPNPATKSSILRVAMESKVKPGSYPLAVEGAAGSLHHRTAVTLVVLAGPQGSLAASPPLQQINQTTLAVTYTVTITPGGDFSGPVQLTVPGLPKYATYSFKPNPATEASTLTVTLTEEPCRRFAPGQGEVSTLTIRGVSRGTERTTSVQLAVQCLLI